MKTDRCTIFQVPADVFRDALNPNKSSEYEYDENERYPTDNNAILEEIDDAIDQLCGSKTLHGGEIIRQYQPSRRWLWAQYRGTILQHNLRITLIAMAFTLAMVILIRLFGNPTWPLGLAPTEDHPLILTLGMIKKVWVS